MFYLGIDIGGTKAAAGIVREDGTILKKQSIPTGGTRESEQIMRDLIMLIKSLMEEAGITAADLHSIGIGSPGILDREKGEIVYINNLNFRHVQVRDEIQRNIPVPVFLENDANCAAIGECFAGAGKDAEDVVVITIGTGLGGGIIINRKLYTGFNGAGGELGHMVINQNGEPCTCGRKGCWEAYASATALIRQARRAVSFNPESKILKLAGGNPDLIDAKTPFDAAKLGDEIAVMVIDRYLDMLAEGLANIINIFQPKLLVIGGGISKEGENLLNPLRKKLKGKTYYDSGMVNTSIVTAVLGNDAGVVGAALLSEA